MTKQNLIQRTVNLLEKLPREKIAEVVNYAHYVLKRHEEEILRQGIQKLASDGKTYDFLNQEEELYTANDVKERYR